MLDEMSLIFIALGVVLLVGLLIEYLVLGPHGRDHAVPPSTDAPPRQPRQYATAPLDPRSPISAPVPSGSAASAASMASMAYIADPYAVAPRPVHSDPQPAPWVRAPGGWSAPGAAPPPTVAPYAPPAHDAPSPLASAPYYAPYRVPRPPHGSPPAHRTGAIPSSAGIEWYHPPYDYHQTGPAAIPSDTPPAPRPRVAEPLVEQDRYGDFDLLHDPYDGGASYEPPW